MYTSKQSHCISDSASVSGKICFRCSRLTFQLEGTPRQASQPEWDRQKTQINQFKEKLTQMQLIMDTKPDGAPLLFNTLLFDALYQLYHNFSFGFTADSTSRQNQNLEKLKPVLELHQLQL